MKTATSAKKPSLEKIKARLVECRRSQRLNFSSLELIEFPQKFASIAKAAGVSTICELDIQSNFFTVLPSELIELRLLKVLKLDHNCFTELPKVLFTFSKLQILSVSNNGIREIDGALQELVSLREINLSRNELTLVPIFWTQMPSLANVNLASNRLKAIPSELGGIKRLQYLDLSDNLLTCLPSALKHLQELISLDVHKNMIRSMPTTLSHLKMLQVLKCEDNPLEEPSRTIALQGFENYMGYLRASYEEEQTPEWAKSRPKETHLGAFKKFETKCKLSNWPIARVGHSVSQVKTKTFVFGGFVTKYGKVDELLVIDSRTMIWSQPITNGCPPSARDNHSATFDGQHRVYFFGGRNDDQKLLNDLYYLDLQSMTWTKPIVDGHLPAIREGAAMVVVNDNVVLFGGQGVHQLFNDINVLDITTWTWTSKSTKGVCPCPRKNVAVVAKETAIYIQGGKADLVYDDMYVLEFASLTWWKIQQEGLTPRYGHLAKEHLGTLYVIGGFNAGGSPKASLHAFKLPPDVGSAMRVVNDPSSMLFSNERSLINDKTSAIYWDELEYIANIKEPHMFSFQESCLIVVKEDDENVTKGDSSWQSSPVYMCWRIYMTTDLESLQVKVCTKATRTQSLTKEGRVFHHVCANAKVLKAVQRDSSKDSKLLEHVKRFSKLFMQEYPERLPLKLMILNECLVQKFICSSIRPSQMTHTEFYNWEGSANFLSKYLIYETLDSPICWPTYIPSPSTIIEWSRGDCFDFSVTLVSLLVGAGYNAFCIVGYAPTHITTKNETLSTFVHSSIQQERRTSIKVVADNCNGNAKPIYKQISNPVVSVPYLAQRRHHRGALLETFVRDFLSSHEAELSYGRSDEQDVLIRYINEKTPDTDSTSDEKCFTSITEDKLCKTIQMVEDDGIVPKKRLHCWAMIAAGQREVTESFFVEPTTGCCFPLQDSPYLEIELAFSHENVWINTQSTSVKDMSWDFASPSRWQKILDSCQITGKIEDSASPGDALQNNCPPNSKVDSCLAYEENSNDGSSLSHSQGKSQGKGGSPKAMNSNKLSTEDAAANQQWLLPVSRPAKLYIPMEAVVTRFHRGVKRTLLYKCEHTMYALYGDHMRWDGLLERVLLFADEQRETLIECHDHFQRRKDKLNKRVYYTTQKKVIEEFGPGTRFSIKQIVTIDGNIQHFTFYPKSRVDGLLRREEILGQSLTEVFDNEEGDLCYRCAHYQSPLFPKHRTFVAKSKEQVGSDSNNNKDLLPSTGNIQGHDQLSRTAGKRYAESSSKNKPMGRPKCTMSSRQGVTKGKLARTMQIEQRFGSINEHSRHASKLKRPSYVVLPISKITQRYLKREGSSQDPTKYEKFSKLESNQMQIECHYVSGHVTYTSRLYEKDGTYHLLHVDPFQPSIHEYARMDEFSRLATTERESIQSIRDAEVETHEILNERSRDEQNVVMLWPYPDIAKYSKEEREDEEDTTKVEGDYLSSFFPPSINPRQHLTRPQMILVRDNCLRALKGRSMRRANIIQSRLEFETSSLTKRRLGFERDREGLTVSEEEEYEKACKKSLFCIRILQQRQKYHENKTLERFQEMESKLRMDPRFTKLYEGST